LILASAITATWLFGFNHMSALGAFSRSVCPRGSVDPYMTDPPASRTVQNVIREGIFIIFIFDGNTGLSILLQWEIAIDESL
jgi:hypothetical protein